MVTEIHTAIAAAKELDRLRNNWLNPPEWTRTEVLEFPGSTDGPWRRYVSLECGGPTPLSLDTQSGGEGAASKPDGDRPSQSGVKPPHSKVGTVRYPRVVPKDEDCAKQLKKRTLTNLYNERPTWLALAHRRLEEAVFTAYGWNPAISDDELLAKLLELNFARTGQK